NNNLRYKSVQERISEVTFRDEQENDQHLLSTLGRIRMDYTPDDKSQIKYRVNFNYLENEDKQFAHRYLDEESLGSTENLLDNSSFSLRQNLSYIRKIGRDDNLGIYVRHQMVNETPDLGIYSTMVPIMIDSLNFYSLTQGKKLNKNNLQIYGIYNHLLNNTSNLRLKLGSNFSWQNLEQKIYEDGNLVSQSPFLTDSDFNYTELYADLTYTKKWGIFKLDIGAGVHHFSEKTKVTNGEQSLNETKILPHLETEFKFSNSQNLTLNYRQEYKLPNLTDLSNGYDVQSYYAVYRGFLGLKESLYHTAELRYGYFNAFSFLRFYAGATYNYSIDNIQTASDLTVLPQKNTLINNPEDDQTLVVYWGGGKRFSRYYWLDLNGNISYLNYYTTINSALVNNTSLTQNYTLSNTFKLKKKVELDLGLNYLNSDFESLAQNKFTTWRPFADFAWSISDKFLFQSDYSYRIQYQNDHLINEFQSLNASLRYHIVKSTYL